VAVATLLLWLCTAAIGSYLLVTAVHAGNAEPEAEESLEPAESVTVPADQPAAASADPAGASQAPADSPAPAKKPRRSDRDRFAPPSLREARSEPMPGIKALAEFAHPALALIGVGFWLGYVVSRDRPFAVIGLGILLGAICAGVSLFTVNTRAAKRLAANPDAAPTAPGTAPLIASPVVLTLHAIGATLTLLFAILIAVHA
jgi:hypothetical protein